MARAGWHGDERGDGLGALMIWLYDRTLVAGSFREAWRRRRRYYAGLAGSWLLLAALWPARAGIEAGRSASASGRLVDHA